MYAIEARNLTKRFGTHVAVSDLSLEIENGSLFGFLGPNGSGKSTTVRMLCGLTTPTSGRAFVEGRDIVRVPRDVQRNVGYMAQGFALYDDLTCDENLEFAARAYRLGGSQSRRRKREVMALTGIDRFRGRRAAELSGGWQRRLALAAALLHDPAVLFLDEPTAGVDPVARRELWSSFETLAAQGKTFFITTHDMDEAQRCSRIGYVFKGALLASGAVADLRRPPATSLEDALVRLVRAAGG